MKKKSIDIKELGIYIVMFILVLFIALPPIFRLTMGDKESNQIPEIPKLTALICKRNVVTEQYQYSITANSTYEDALTKVTFTYQSNPLEELTPNEEGTNETDGTEETPATPDESGTTETDSENQTTDEATQPVTDMDIQEEVQALKGIEGIEAQEEENLTRLVLTNKVLENLEETSPFRKYYQELEEQQAFFEGKGYSCEVIKN